MKTVKTPAIMDARSSDIYRKARKLLPGGVNSPVRAMQSIERDPLFMARGSGAEIIDVDSNTYIDYVCSWGPLILGHSHPQVVQAVCETAQLGTSFGAPTEAEVTLAETVRSFFESVDMVRMTSSGTEAAMTALRLARAVTGRSQILKFSGGYHGHVDGLLSEAGSGLATSGLPASAGVSETQTSDTVLAEFNNLAAVEQAFTSYDLAAVIVEPFLANAGLILPQPGFLERLRELCDQNDALLIFDEVITGFRVGRGGAQEYVGVTPDLTMLGKIIGGGLPAAAVAGKRAIMECLAPVGDVYQAGTLSGNPVAVAAGQATLDQLGEEAYARLAAITSTLAQGLRESAGDLAVQVVDVPGLLTVFFSDRPITNYADARQCDRDRYAAFVRGMLARGVYPPPSQFETWFPSLAHTDEQIGATIEAAKHAFACL